MLAVNDNRVKVGFQSIVLGVSLGQDVAELLGVIGILPIHPSTHLRLRKVHETRANTVIRETPGMLGEVTILDAAKKRLQMEDEFEYSRRDGVNALVDGECKFILLNL